VLHKQIRTTVNKARAASSLADKMVTLAKRGDLHARRTLISNLGCQDTADTLIEKIAPHFKNRAGGYTRVLRLGFRPGDGGETALLEFTERVEPEKKAKPKKVKKEKAQAGHAVEEKTAKSKKESKKEQATAEAEEKETEKKESEKKGGFLGALRKFLKGDEK
jgi:large subunit ribosomal protein L17